MHHGFLDIYSDKDLPIHRLNPTLKLITTVIFLFIIVLTPPHFFILFAVYLAFIFTLIFISKISLKLVFKRILMILPFILMVTIFIPFMKEGRPIVSHPFGLGVTYEGLLILWNVFAKSILSIMLVTVLMSTTRFNVLIHAMEHLKVPALFLMILQFMYRFIFVIFDELMRARMAKEARSVGGPRLYHIKAMAYMLGGVFIKSFERAEGVYLAMCARGYRGYKHE